MVLFLILAVFSLLLSSIPAASAVVTGLDVTPEVVVPGETLLLSGKASSPGEDVWLSSSFEMELPVSDGEYVIEFNGIDFPRGEKKFSIVADDVKDIRISLYPVFWRKVEYPLQGPLNATDGTARISISFPATYHNVTIDISGKKDIKVYGDAADGANSVNLKVATAINVIADQNGDFSLNVSTGGVPDGEFLITAGELKKTVYIGTAPQTSSPTPTISQSQHWIPGFEAVFGIAGLLAVAYFLVLRSRK